MWQFCDNGSSIGVMADTTLSSSLSSPSLLWWLWIERNYLVLGVGKKKEIFRRHNQSPQLLVWLFLWESFQHLPHRPVCIIQEDWPVVAP
jgi:hypothetical protein